MFNPKKISTADLLTRYDTLSKEVSAASRDGSKEFEYKSKHDQWSKIKVELNARGVMSV